MAGMSHSAAFHHIRMSRYREYAMRRLSRSWQRPILMQCLYQNEPSSYIQCSEIGVDLYNNGSFCYSTVCGAGLKRPTIHQPPLTQTEITHRPVLISPHSDESFPHHLSGIQALPLTAMNDSFEYGARQTLRCPFIAECRANPYKVGDGDTPQRCCVKVPCWIAKENNAA